MPGSSGSVTKASPVPLGDANGATAAISLPCSASSRGSRPSSRLAMPVPGVSHSAWEIAGGVELERREVRAGDDRAHRVQDLVELRRAHVALQHGDVRGVRGVEREALRHRFAQPRVEVAGAAAGRLVGLDQDVDGCHLCHGRFHDHYVPACARAEGGPRAGRPRRDHRLTSGRMTGTPRGDAEAKEHPARSDERARPIKRTTSAARRRGGARPHDAARSRRGGDRLRRPLRARAAVPARHGRSRARHAAGVAERDLRLSAGVGGAVPRAVRGDRLSLVHRCRP